MRKRIIAGNWKMNKTSAEAIDLANRINRELNGLDDVDVVLCPPFISLDAVHEVIMDTSIALGAQNVHWEREGAFTGEVSCGMLKDIGCAYVIVGHSERRALFGEINDIVNKKAKAALSSGLIPIVCVGETLAQREAKKTFEVITDHIENSLAGFSKEEIEKTIIAYEPVWAIGTGVNATPEQAEEAHRFIRKLLEKRFGGDAAESVRIQYGGSVKPDNIQALIGQQNVDGALVGGASLKAESFIAIVKQSSQTKKQVVQ